MCGIVGYVGRRAADDLLLGALKRLEYRGYDSCGIAVLDNGNSRLVRAPGRIAELESRVNGNGNGNGASPNGVVRCGIGHTRWATHGRPTESNAHPHVDCSGRIIVAHNGIIENYSEIKKALASGGHDFLSETDTEVLPHLVEKHFRGDLVEAVRLALAEVEGTYGCVFISQHDKDKIVAARQGASLVIGIGEGENYIASDAAALLSHTEELLFLEDGDVAVVEADRVQVYDHSGAAVKRQSKRATWGADAAEKQGYSHFMLKEIHEQPGALRETLVGRLRAERGVTLDDDAGVRELLSTPERISMVACGTSLHAALIGKHLIEQMARVPVDVEFASEFRYRQPLLDDRSLVVGISQSGETADTVAALEEARKRGASLLAVCNVMESSIARLSDGVLYTRAGVEIGVASTKSFTTQIAALALIALELAGNRGTLSEAEVRQRCRELRAVPDLIDEMLADTRATEDMARRLAGFEASLYLGRGISYPMAIEGALKLKEIAYINAQGYAAGEMKHGPIALIDDEMIVVTVAPRDSVYRKTISNVQETKVRGGHVMAVGTEGDDELAEIADDVVFVPAVAPWLSPLLTAVPLQLLAFHAGLERGCDVDKPRNLAKSVTVE